MRLFKEEELRAARELELKKKKEEEEKERDLKRKARKRAIQELEEDFNMEVSSIPIVLVRNVLILTYN